MKPRGVILLLSVAAIALLMVDIATGTSSIPLSDVVAALCGGDVPVETQTIIIDIRLLKAITATLVGISLGISGLQMQTIFRNPLAGPYTLGVSSGASLGVALFILGAPLLGIGSSTTSMGIAAPAWLGAATVLVVINILSRRLNNIMVILILGMMFSSGVSAVVQILQYLSRDEALKSFVVWTMGSLGDVTRTQMAIFFPSVLLGLALSILTIKSLNLLLLGETYATSMGLDIKRSRSLIFLSTTLLAGTVTAFCGPIGFIGLAVPHIARALVTTVDHRHLLPITALTGAVVMLACDLISKQLALPINSITALLGIPVVVWIVLRKNSFGHA